MTIKTMLATLLLALAAPGMAQDAFPSRPVHLILPFQPGSAPDITARLIAQKLSPALGQTVIVENRPGAGGLLGADLVAKAAPDGYSIGYVSNQHVLHKYLVKKLPYDFFKDLQPVHFIGTGGQVVVVRPSEPANTLAEFIAALKQRGRTPLYGSGGLASPAHLAGQALGSLAGIKVTHIPYKGSPDSINGLIGGDIDYIVTTIPTAAPLIRAGKLKALAVSTSERDPAMPEVPMLTEALPPGFVYEPWALLVTSSRVPAPLVKKLADILRALQDDKDLTRRLLETAGLKVRYIPTDKVHAYLREDEAKVSRWLAEAGVQPE